MHQHLIKLTLIDDATDAIIGESAVDAQAIPESFRPDTTLQIGDKEWSVVQAEPTTRAEYVDSGQVVLRLHRIESVDPQEILYSLPTVWHGQPPTGGPLLEGRELLLHEDEWRQVELVSLSQKDVVGEELAEITEVLKTSRVEGVGFRKIHLRKRLEQPLQGVELSLESLRRTFESATESKVVLHDSSHCVTDSFSFFLTREVALYGVCDAAGVDVLAVAVLGHERQSVPLPGIRRLADEVGLLAVDWCGVRQAEAAHSTFEDVLVDF